MSNIPLPLTDNTFFIDNSSMELITTCPRAAEYYINGKRELNRDRPALKFGGIIHKILETRYREYGTKPIDDIVTARMLQIAAQEFENYTPPEDDFRTYQLAVDFIEAYSDAYRNESFEVVGVELPFAVPLFELPIEQQIMVRDGDSIFSRFVDKITVLWQGRGDILYRKDGKLYGLDHKTTSMMGPSYFKEFDLSAQMKGYAWAFGQLLQERIRGFCINGLGIRKPTKTGKKIELQRYTVEYTQDQLEEWKTETIDIITSYIHNVLRGFLPRHTKWCVGKYGACQFFNVCTLPRDQRALMLSTNDFKTVTWSPLNNEN